MAEGGHEVDRWLIHGVESFKVLFVLHLPCRLFVLFCIRKIGIPQESTKKRIIMAEQQTKVPDKSATTQVNAARHHS